jgi:hypothetical protein
VSLRVKRALVEIDVTRDGVTVIVGDTVVLGAVTVLGARVVVVVSVSVAVTSGKLFRGVPNGVMGVFDSLITGIYSTEAVTVGRY